MIIVSCYYNIPSKQPKEFYYNHISRFFKKITWQTIVFFTDSENYPLLSRLAGSNVKFIIQPFEDSKIFDVFSQEFWKEQIKYDPEKYHTWQLGALWASKIHFVKQASELYSSENWFIWVDAGSVRSESWNLTNFTRRNTFTEPKVYLQFLDKLPNKQFFIDPDRYNAGSHILIHRTCISAFIDLYILVVQLYVKNNVPVILDQNIINTMVLSNQNFIRQVLRKGKYIDEWFFFFDMI